MRIHPLLVAGLLCAAPLLSLARAGELVLETRSADLGKHPNHTVVPGKVVIDPAKKLPGRGFHIWLDREEYDPRDVTAVVLVGIEQLNIPPAQASVLLRVMQAGKQVAAERIAELSGIRTSVVLAMTRIPPGEYELTADLTRGDQKVASDSRPFRKAERKQLAKGPTSGRIPIRVWAAPQAKGVHWPISTGVPFAQGVLHSDDRVSLLDPSGREVVCQTSVRSTWNPRGSIQWLGLDFVPTLSDREQEYTLVYGLEKPRPAAPEIRCEESKDFIQVDTGPLQFVASRRRLIETVSLDNKLVLEAGAGAGLSLVDHEGNRYEAAADRAAEIVVEENGPVKLVIRVTGWYVKQGSDGKRLSCELPTDRLCKYTVRLTAYAGQPILRAAVTTVLTYDSTKVRLRDLAIGFTPKDAKSVRIGIDKKTPLAWDNSRLKKNPFLVQDRWDTSFDDSKQDHGRASGWIEVAGGEAELLVGVRNFWKLFPKEVEWRDGTLLVHPWPAHAQPRTFNRDDELAMQNIYKLWYAHQGKELDFRFPADYAAALDAELRKSPKAFGEYYKDMEKSNAQGIAVHNDFVLAFQPTGESKLKGETVSFLADDDPHAYADPAYVCATGVFGPMLHADSTHFGDIERTVRSGFQSLASRSQANNEYGMFIHGGEHTYWNYTKQPPHAGIHRVWINGHYQIPRVAQMQYVRSGDPIYLRWGRENLANLRDIGIVHYISDERRFYFHDLGAMYHCKGFAPWAGDSGLAFHMSIYDFLIYDYYLTGDRRSLNVVHEWLQGLKEASPRGWATREGTTALSQMVEAYRLTWDAALLELMDRFAVAIFDRPLPTGDPNPGFDWDPPFLMRWHWLTGHRKGLEALHAARAMPYGLNGARYGLFVARNNDTPKEVALGAEALYRDSLARVDQPGVYADGLTKPAWISYAYYVHHLPYLLKAMRDDGVKIARPSLTAPIELPTLRGTSRVVVREVADRAIPVKLAFAEPPTGKIRATVFRSDGKKVVDTSFAPTDGSTTAPLQLTIPEDGIAEDYLIVLETPAGAAAPRWPLTDLKHEVAILGAGQNVLPAALRMQKVNIGGRLYFTPDGATPREVVVSSNLKTGVGLELVDAHEKPLGRASHSRYVGRPQTLTLPESGAGTCSLYVSDPLDLRIDGDKRLIVGLRPEALFTPKIVREPK